MTMLPDIDEQTYTADQQEEFKRRQDEQMGRFSFMQSAQSQIAQLQGAVGQTAAHAAGAAGQAVGGAAQAVGNTAEAAGTAVDQGRQSLIDQLQSNVAQTTQNLGQEQPQPQPQPQAPQTPPQTAEAPAATAGNQDLIAQLQSNIAQTTQGLPPAQSAQAPAANNQDLISQLQSNVSQTTQGLGQAATQAQQGGQDLVAQLQSNVAQTVDTASQAGQQALSSITPGASVPGGDLHDYARSAAQRAGIDPDVFVAQIQQESGFRPDAKSPAGAIGIAQFMPDTAKGVGVDPTDPYAALDAAARMDAQHLDQYGGDWSKVLAAYNAGPGAVAKYGGVPPYEETQRYVSTILGNAKKTAGDVVGGVTGAVGGAASAVGDRAQQTYQDISQFGDSQLSSDEAYAACGPAAAVRFAQRFGRNPTLREATDLAKSVGWTAAQGMAGLASEQGLMNKLGVQTVTIGADIGRMAREAATGNPVTISTPGHYFYADGYNEQTGAFHVGKSGTDLRGGSEWMTPDQMQARMGAIQGGLLADNPTVPAQSTAKTTAAPGRTVNDIVSATEGAVGTGVQNLMQTSDQAQERGRAWLDEQTRNLDQAVSTAATAIPAQKSNEDILAQSPTYKSTMQPAEPEQPVAPTVQYDQPQQSVWDKVGTGIADVFRQAFGGAQDVAARADRPSQTIGGVPIQLPEAMGGRVATNVAADVLGGAAGAVRENPTVQAGAERWGAFTEGPGAGPLVGEARRSLAEEQLRREDPAYGSIADQYYQLANDISSRPADLTTGRKATDAELDQLDALREQKNAYSQQALGNWDTVDALAKRNPQYDALTGQAGFAQGLAAAAVAPETLAGKLPLTSVGGAARLAAGAALDPAQIPFTAVQGAAEVPGVLRGARAAGLVEGGARAEGGAADLSALDRRLAPEVTADSPYNVDNLMQVYERETPARIASIQERVQQHLTPLLTPKGGDEQASRDLVQQVWDAGRSLLEDSRVTATGLSEKAAAALADRGEFTNKLNGVGSALDSAEAARAQVSTAKRNLTLADGEDFVRGEAEADRMALGGTQALDELGSRDPDAPNRVYAYTSAGPPMIGPQKPAMWVVWEDGAPRVVSAHHHYGIARPNADIHAATQPGLKRLMWEPSAIAGDLVKQAGSIAGDTIENWQGRGLDVGGGRKIAQTDALVGPSGENDMRMATALASMPQTLAERIRKGQLTDPEQIASILLREDVPRSQPGGLAYRQLLNPDNPDAVKIPDMVRQALGLGAVDNGKRTESLMVNPSLKNVKAIYLAGTPRDLTDTANLANVGGRNRYQLAQDVRRQIMDATGKDVPIMFKDITPQLSGEEASIPSKLISEVQKLEGPDGVTLAPGRERIVRGYTSAGYPNIGLLPGERRGLPGGIGEQALYGAIGAGSQAAQQEGATPEDVAKAALGGAGLGALRGGLTRAAGMPLSAGGLGRVARIAERVGETAGEAGRTAAGDARRAAEDFEARAAGRASEGPTGSAAPGNQYGLNVDKFKYHPEEIQQVIQDAYDKVPDVMDEARRGVMPDQVVRDMGEAIGADKQRLNAMLNFWKPGQARNAESIFAMRQALADSGANVVEAQKALRENPTDIKARLQMLDSMTRHQAVQEAVAGVTAEAGRAVRQFREPVEGTQLMLDRLTKMAKAKGMDAEELVNHLADVNLDDPSTLNGLVRMLNPASKMDKVMALWYFNMLSSPVTHMRNIIGNSVAAASVAPEALGAAAMDPLARGAMRAIGGKTAGRERYFGEALAQPIGQLAGLDPKLADMVGLEGGLGGGIKNAVEALAHGPSPESVLAGRAHPEAWLQGDLPLLPQAAQKALGLTIHSTGRALEAEDLFFRSLNQQGAAYRMAYRQALQEGVRGVQDVRDRMYDIMRNPSEDFLKQLQEEGKYRTFQQDTGLSKALLKFRHDVPAARFLIPFARTPVNMMQYTLERSPLGLAKIGSEFLTPTGRAGLRQRGAGDLAERLSRGAIGSTVMGGLAAWGGDNITARPPDDPTERDAFYRQGKQPYSFRSPLDQKWYSYQALQPYAPLIAAAANIRDVLNNPKKGNPKDVAGLAALAAFSAGQSMVDMPFAQGLKDVMDLMDGQGHRGRDPLSMAEDWLERQATGVVPASALMRTLARAQDNTLRDPQNVLEAMMANVPGLQGRVQPRLNVFGEARRGPTTGLDVLNPFNPSAPNEDPVEKELERLDLRGYDVQPGFVGKTINVAGQPVELRNEQEQSYQRQAGQLTYAMLQVLVGSNDWQAASDADKVKAVDTVTSRVRDAVRTEMTPELWDQAIEAMVDDMRRKGTTSGSGAAAPAAATPTPEPTQSSGPIVNQGRPIINQGR